MPEWGDVLKFLAGFLTGFSFKWLLVWRSNRTSLRQQGNVVGGSLAGRDVNIKNRK